MFFVSILVLIVLMPLSHSVPEPAFDAPSTAVLAYAKSETNLPFALELVGVLGLFGFAVFATVLADGFRIKGEGSNVPSLLVLLATAVFMVLWLAELALHVAQTFRRADLDATGASVLDGLANGVFVMTWVADAGFLVAVAVGIFWRKTLPSWLGWWALVTGIAMFGASAAPLAAIWYLPYFLFYFWVLAMSVVLLRNRPAP